MPSLTGVPLVLLAVALTVATVAIVILARIRVWRASGPAGPDPQDPPELDDYELAYLNGGPALAATTAAVTLLRAGHLAGTEPAERHLSQEVHLRPGTPPPSPHPVEQAVYALVATHPGAPFLRLQELTGDTPAVTTVRDRLRVHGLALTDREVTAYRATVLWFLPLLALAVALAVATVAADSRDAFPVLAMTVLVGMVLPLAGWFSTYEPPVATPYGRRALTALRAATPALSATLKVPDWSTSGAEAAGGTEFTGVSG